MIIFPLLVLYARSPQHLLEHTYADVSEQFFFLAFSTMALLGVQNGTGKKRYLIPDEMIPMGMEVYRTLRTWTKPVLT
jgi:hypothetical protein